MWSTMSRRSGLSMSAVVVAPAPPGVGGQGGAAADIALGVDAAGGAGAVRGPRGARGAPGPRPIRAVDRERFRPGEAFPELTVAFVGVLSLWKGADVVVELAHRLAGRGAVAVVGGPVCPWSRALVAGAPLERRAAVAPLLAGAQALVL